MPQRPGILWLLCVWLTAAPAFLPAQYHLTKTYTVRDGLPMTEVGYCLVSRKGYVYFTSTTGQQMMFDGFQFRKLTARGKTRKSSDVEFLGEDQYGIWFILGGEVHRYVDHREMEVKAPPAVSFFLDDMNDRLVLEDEQHNLLVFNPLNNHFEKEPTLTARRARYDTDAYYSLISKFDRHWEVVSNEDLTAKWVYALDENLNGTGRLLYPEPVEGFCPLSADTYLINISQSKSAARRNVETRFFDGEKWTVLRGEDWSGRQRQFTNFYFYSVQERAFLYGPAPPAPSSGPEDWELWEIAPNGDLSFLARFQVPASLNSFRPQPDPAGNFWLPSQSGLIKILPAFLGCFEDHPNMAGGLHTINEDAEGQIWFGFYSRGFARFDGSRILPPPAGAVPDDRILPGTWRDADGNMYFFKNNHYGLFRTNGRTWTGIDGPVPPEERMTGYYFLPLANHQLALGLNNYKGIGLMDPPYRPGTPFTHIDSTKGMSLRNVLTLTEDREHRLWFGRTSEGVGVYDPQLDTAVTWLLAGRDGIGALSSLTDSRGNLWLGTNRGLAFLPEPHTFDFLRENINNHVKVLHLPQTGNSVVTFLTEHRGYLCFGNLQGFGLLDLESFYRDPDQPRIHFFNTTDYLPLGSSEQNAVLVDRSGRLWMGSDAGAVRLDLDLLTLDTSAIHLDTLVFFHGGGERSFPQENTLRLPRGQRDVAFYWHSTFDGQLTPNRWLSYRLILASGDTLNTADYLLTDRVDLGYIPPGNHRLELTLFKNNQVHDQTTIPLVIPKNLEDTWWFWALISGFLLLAGGLIFWQLYQKKRQRQRFELQTERLIREKEALQIEAVTSSLNPHFLNNTLHWVQAKVRKDDIATLFIEKLANNIRIIFQKSRNREAFHSLLEEMELVKNYLTIQTYRFGDRYRFEFPSEEEVRQYRHIQVPLMQLQIHAENAIERGLRNRTGSTYLCIALREDAEYLHITVEDDGIGYSNARKMNAGGTQQGAKMLDSLHQIFNARNEKKITTTIEDNLFTDAAGRTYGTRITIQIPKKYNYEFETDQGTGRGRRTPGP